MAYTVVSFLVVGLSNHLQLFKECVFLVLRIQLLASRLLGDQTIYNLSRNSFSVDIAIHFLSTAGVSWLPAYRTVYIGRSIIIQRMRYSSTAYIVVSFRVTGLLDDLQSANGNVSQHLQLFMGDALTILIVELWIYELSNHQMMPINRTILRAMLGRLNKNTLKGANLYAVFCLPFASFL